MTDAECRAIEQENVEKVRKALKTITSGEIYDRKGYLNEKGYKALEEIEGLDLFWICDPLIKLAKESEKGGCGMIDLPETFDGHKLGDFVVGDNGISRIIEVDGYAGYTGELVLPKEVFIEAYNKYIKDEVVERSQGEWIIVKDEKYGDNVKCPFCGKELAGTDLNFCVKCGAQMKGSAE